MPEPARLAFMGTSPFAVPALERLARGPHAVVAVYTQPPRPAGRGMRERRTAVHEAADGLGLEVRTPASLRRPPEVGAAFRALGADLAVVAAYGLLLPRPILDAPRRGCVNLHASILPRWRGAAPIQRAVMAGDAETGVAIFRMEEGLDTGPVHGTRTTPIGPRETAGELHDRLAVLAADLLEAELPGLLSGTAAAVPQPAEGALYAPKVEKAEGRLDFALAAAELDRRVRALAPAPGAFTELRGERLLVLEAEPAADDGAGGAEPGTVVGLPLDVACGRGGVLRVRRVQRAGRKPVTADELRRGLRLAPGERLG